MFKEPPSLEFPEHRITKINNNQKGKSAAIVLKRTQPRATIKISVLLNPIYKREDYSFTLTRKGSLFVRSKTLL